jgi:hypothetical protein
LLCAIGLCACATRVSNVYTEPVTEELRLAGWITWGNGLKSAAQGNTVIFNGNTDAAGYLSTQLDTALRNKTVILEIQNIDSSQFSEDRMLKITVNWDDRLVHPVNVNMLIYGEYIPASYNRIEFAVPGDFDGKMNLVFYQASLNNLKITAYYK